MLIHVTNKKRNLYIYKLKYSPCKCCKFKSYSQNFVVQGHFLFVGLIVFQWLLFLHGNGMATRRGFSAKSAIQACFIPRDSNYCMTIGPASVACLVYRDALTFSVLLNSKFSAGLQCTVELLLCCAKKIVHLKKR